MGFIGDKLEQWKEKRRIREEERELYPFGKPKEQSRFIVWGGFGRRHKQNLANVQQAVQELGFDDKVLYLSDNRDIVRYGVLYTPALVVDGTVVSKAEFLSVEEAKDYITEALQNENSPSDSLEGTEEEL